MNANGIILNAAWVSHADTLDRRQVAIDKMRAEKNEVRHQ